LKRQHVAHALLRNATYFSHNWNSAQIVGQSWLQPAFSRLSTDARARPLPEEPPKKAAAGKIACPTTNVEMPRMGKACGVKRSCLPYQDLTRYVRARVMPCPEASVASSRDAARKGACATSLHGIGHQKSGLHQKIRISCVFAIASSRKRGILWLTVTDYRRLL
jgi:hypothetical protein